MKKALAWWSASPPACSRSARHRQPGGPDQAVLEASRRQTRKRHLGVPHRLDRPASGRSCLPGTFARPVGLPSSSSIAASKRSIGRVWKVACRPTRNLARPGEKDTGHGTSRGCRSRSPRRAGSGQALPHTARFDWGTWLEIRLETGRMHQVRIQCVPVEAMPCWATNGTAARPFGIEYDDRRLRAIALHARSLAFDHPMTHHPVHVVAPLPQIWVEHGIDRGLSPNLPREVCRRIARAVLAAKMRRSCSVAQPVP